MNKFELNVLKSNALVSVHNTVQYNIDSLIEDKNAYEERAKEDESSYWQNNAIECGEKLELWREIETLLEKKLIK